MHLLPGNNPMRQVLLLCHFTHEEAPLPVLALQCRPGPPSGFQAPLLAAHPGERRPHPAALAAHPRGRRERGSGAHVPPGRGRPGRAKMAAAAAAAASVGSGPWGGRGRWRGGGVPGEPPWEAGAVSIAAAGGVAPGNFLVPGLGFAGILLEGKQWGGGHCGSRRRAGTSWAPGTPRAASADGTVRR